MNLCLKVFVAITCSMFLCTSLFAEEKGSLVTISGEVVFPGQYVCIDSRTTAAEIIDLAGGLTSDAYSEGISVQRLLTDEEYGRMELACRLANEQLAAIDVKLQVPDRTSRYTIDSATALRGGDEIIVPKQSSTVMISGAVQYPSVVTFEPGASLRDYIRMAGGFAKGAARGSVRILSPSGEESGRGGTILPGSEIRVLTRGKSGKNAVFAEEILSICTSTGSVAEMVVMLVERITD